jgi:flagellar protein FlgJ
MLKASNIYDTLRLQSVGTDKIKQKYAGRGNFLSVLKAVEESDERSSRQVKEKRNERLMNVCIEMESLFVARMLKEMRNTVHKNALLHGGFAEEVFEDMLYDEYALELSRNSNLGLAKMLYEELSKR